LGLASAFTAAPSLVQALPHSDAAAWHYGWLVALSLGLVGGAMYARRKVPLLVGSAALILGTLVKAVEWAFYHEVLLPVLGIGVGFVILAAGCLFESRMNRVFRAAVDKARVEARMFWEAWK
jgi:hypothetical protein